jgi:hypothetical protein
LDMGHTLRENVHGRNRKREGNPKLENVWCALSRGANIVTLKWQRSLWEGDWEVVRRSGRDEPMWVAIRKCMEATLGISLYSCLHLKLAKIPCLSYYLLCFLFSKIGEQEGGTGSAWKGGSGRTGDRWHQQCIHM